MPHDKKEQQIQTLQQKSYHNQPVKNVFFSAPVLVPYANLWRPDYKVLVKRVIDRKCNLVITTQNCCRDASCYKQLKGILRIARENRHLSLFPSGETSKIQAEILKIFIGGTLIRVDSLSCLDVTPISWRLRDSTQIGIFHQ